MKVPTPLLSIIAIDFETWEALPVRYEGKRGRSNRGLSSK
jgi:hypothetical protein